MNYSNIKFGEDINSDGLSVSLYVSGCDFRCRNCFNEEIQDKNYGSSFNKEVKESIYKYFEDNFKYIDNLCILGGDSMMSYNYKSTLEFVKEFKHKFPTKMVFIWTGYKFEYLLQNRRDILDYVDVICDGQFEQDKFKKNLKYVGSLNQEIIDVQETLKQNKKVLYFEN